MVKQQTEILRIQGTIIKILKNLYKKEPNFGSKIMRECDLGYNCVSELKKIIDAGYIKRIKSKDEPNRKKYYILTKKGKSIIEEFILIERKIYGKVL